MILVACFVFCAVWLLLPIGIGYAWISLRDIRYTAIGGLFTSWCLFEILAMIFHVTLGSLRLMTVLWCILCCGIALFGYWRRFRCRAQISAPARPAAAEAWTRLQVLLLILILALVALHTLNTVLNTYYWNYDDETYRGTAVTSWYTDTVDRYAPNSGTLQKIFYNEKYVIASWPVFSSVLAVLTKIHPAIIFRTIMPVFLVPLSYGIAYLIIRHFFPASRGKALLGMLYYILFVFVTTERTTDITNCEWWFVVNPWTGKALTGILVIPLLFWLLLRLNRCTDAGEQTAIWRTLLVVSWGACFVSASLFFLVPLQLGVWGLLYMLRRKNPAAWWKFALCAVPSLFCALFTYF